MVEPMAQLKLFHSDASDAQRVLSHKEKATLIINQIRLRGPVHSLPAPDPLRDEWTYP